MSDLENLSRKQLQTLAKKHGIRANQKTARIVAELKLLLESPRAREEKEQEEPGPSDAGSVKWFVEAGTRFAIGIELYKGGFPIVSDDRIRSYIKVYMRGLPHTDMTDEDVVCQLFYLSSGANTNLGGVWVPSNVASLMLHTAAARSEWKWKWYLQKKPWFIGDEWSAVDGYNPAMRYGGDPCIAMVSLILGGFGFEDTFEDNPESGIDALARYVSGNLKHHLTKRFGKKEGAVMYETMMEYYAIMSGFINKYLLSHRKIRPICDDYDLDMWTGRCTSYNWFAPFDKARPGYIPNLDPRDEDSLWEEQSPGKLILQRGWLDHPDRTMSYLEYKKRAEQGFPSLSVLDKARTAGRWKVIQRTHLGPYGAELPANITSREELRKRKD